MPPVADLLTTRQVAELIGVKPASVSKYHARGDMPRPDEYIGRTPVWFRTTIDRWLPERPGQGSGGGRPRKTTTLGSDHA